MLRSPMGEAPGVGPGRGFRCAGAGLGLASFCAIFFASAAGFFSSIFGVAACGFAGSAAGAFTSELFAGSTLAGFSGALGIGFGCPGLGSGTFGGSGAVG